MKRISLLLLAATLAMPVISRGQDAATEERLNKLSAQIEVLVEAKELQNKRIEELAKQIRDLQDQVSKPSGNYASADDLKQLAAKLKEVDDKRVQDNENVVKAIEKLGKTLGSTSIKKTTPVAPVNTSAGPIPDKGYEYVIKEGDTVAAVVAAYRSQNIKVTIQQVLNANPGLDPKSLKVGQKIFIPAPTQ